MNYGPTVGVTTPLFAALVGLRLKNLLELKVQHP